MQNTSTTCNFPASLIPIRLMVTNKRQRAEAISAAASKALGWDHRVGSPETPAPQVPDIMERAMRLELTTLSLGMRNRRNPGCMQIAGSAASGDKKDRRNHQRDADQVANSFHAECCQQWLKGCLCCYLHILFVPSNT